MRSRHHLTIRTLSTVALILTAVAACGADEGSSTGSDSGTDDTTLIEPAPTDETPSSGSQSSTGDMATSVSDPTTDETDPTGPESSASDPVTSDPAAVEVVTSSTVETIDAAPLAALLAPWQGGFLAIGREAQPQLLPELDPEIVTLFPPEVTELLTDGPYDRYEAAAILGEAGLLDEVLEVLEQHPEAAEAVETDPPPPLMMTAWSEDGTGWTPTGLTHPEGIAEVADYSVRDDRLTVVGFVEPYGSALPATLAVATTTDLATWETVEFTVNEDQTEDALATTLHAFPTGVAANDEGWVVPVVADWPSESDDPPNLRSQIWAGSWSDTAERSDVAAFANWIVATRSGFVAALSESFIEDGEISFSPDGLDWSAVELPDDGLRISGIAPLREGLVMFGGMPTGAKAGYVADATATEWRRVDLPAEIGHLGVRPSSSPAFLAHDDSLDHEEGWWLIATADGESWLVEPYERAGEGQAHPALAATDGEYVITAELVGPWDDGTEAWQRRSLPSSDPQ